MMNITDISFPNLNLYLSNVPKNITVFGFDIALYGVVIATGMVLGIVLASYIAKKYGYDKDIIWDFAIYGIIFGILGARIYYIIFSWDYYKDHLIEVFYLRNGGLAIYGAVIAAFLVLFIYSRMKKIHYLTMADICVPGLALGQAIGRWGNFFNREVFGEYTDNILAMRLPIDAVRPVDISTDLASHILEGTNYIQVHPTFLYECLWNLALVALMVFVWKYRKFDGQISLLYLGGYGLGRFWIEGIRTDQLKIGNTGIAVSQALALVMLIGAVIVTVIALKRTKVKMAQGIEIVLPNTLTKAVNADNPVEEENTETADKPTENVEE